MMAYLCVCVASCNLGSTAASKKLDQKHDATIVVGPFGVPSSSDERFNSDEHPGLVQMPALGYI